LHTLHWYISVVGRFPCSVCSSRVPGSQQISQPASSTSMRAICFVLMMVLFLSALSRRRPFFNYQGLIVCEVLLLVFGFCFICSAFVVDVQAAMVYHFCSLQMLLVHIVKSIRWVIESSHNATLFVVPKRGCLIVRVKGLDLTMLYVIFM